MSMCIFCGKDPRVKKSHIVPDYLYDEVKEDGKIIPLNEKLVQEGKWRQSGFYEPLLCKVCEGDFNKRFDQPCVQFFRSLCGPYKIGELNIISVPLQIRKLSLSVLFRALHAENPKWNAVEKLWSTQGLKECLADGVDDPYRIYARILCDDGGMPIRGMVVSPSAIRLSKTWFTCMIFGGFEFIQVNRTEDIEIDMDELPRDGGTARVMASRLIDAWSLHSMSATY